METTEKAKKPAVAKAKAKIKAKAAAAGKGVAKGAGAAKPLTMRQKRLQRAGNANKVTFTLEPEVRALCASEAKKANMQTGHYLQRLVENALLEGAAADDTLANRLRAKRAVIDHTISLARKIDADGGFDEHFILTVMKSATTDPDFTRVYEAAVLTESAKPGAQERAKASLNQQLGRLIKKSVGASSKVTEAGTIARAQVSGEVISAYTLLEKAA